VPSFEVLNGKEKEKCIKALESIPSKINSVVVFRNRARYLNGQIHEQLEEDSVKTLLPIATVLLVPIM
jgi:predicted CoA-binding protein